VTVYGYIGIVRNTYRYGEEYSDVTVHRFLGMVRNTVI
jgi:hypothetical protein